MSESVLPVFQRAPLCFERGEGCWLYDAHGEAYLDAGSGIAVTSLGHAHTELVDVLREQAGILWHTSNLYEVAGQKTLADMLVDATFADTVFLTNSGTEAMEAAVKMARRYWHVRGQKERKTIVTLEGSFHGRSLGMISAAGSRKLVDGFEPLLPGFVQIPVGDVDSVAAVLDETCAAIMVETVQGEGGIVPLADEYLQQLRELCDASGALLILDEIQCGAGRTGKLFAHEWAGITPDIMGIAKGIGSGFPMGACLATRDAAIGMTAGTHGTTFGGNPLACAVGAKVLEVLRRHGFLSHVQEVAGSLRDGLDALVADNRDLFDCVRGRGLMLGLKCRVVNTDLIAAGYAGHLLTVPASDNVIRILPPLIMTGNEAGMVLERLKGAVVRYREGCRA
ncbi:MAG: aspartate aminotransferase family protein [Rhodobacteraceae bacterium]|nr:aspartate aminotransferase family protein [Paracoccaceae bacterium]